jgi:hypothetical protein
MAGALDAGKKCIDEVAAALTETFRDAAISSSVPLAQFGLICADLRSWLPQRPTFNAASARST